MTGGRLSARRAPPAGRAALADTARATLAFCSKKKRPLAWPSPGTPPALWRPAGADSLALAPRRNGVARTTAALVSVPVRRALGSPRDVQGAQPVGAHTWSSSSESLDTLDPTRWPARCQQFRWSHGVCFLPCDPVHRGFALQARGCSMRKDALVEGRPASKRISPRRRSYSPSTKPCFEPEVESPRASKSPRASYSNRSGFGSEKCATLPSPMVVPPTSEHTHTIFLLHGYTASGEDLHRSEDLHQHAL
eukprot:SAG31_NODE_874_length_11319_cov_3.145098_6_plen_250_part_00